MSGVDPDQPSRPPSPAQAGCFPLASLDSLGAFLAVRMNGDALPLDHGRPVRLAVPGWYGCSWIKWVDEIRLVDASEPATSQMREFAARTHQTAVHDLAGVYAPPVIQTAATAVRVEKRLGASGLEYRVVGIVWGGARAVDRLAIRFSDGERVGAVRCLPRAGKPGHLVAVELSLEARRARCVQHRVEGSGLHRAPTPPRERLLRSAGQDR